MGCFLTIRISIRYIEPRRTQTCRICFHGGTDRPPFAPGRDDVGNNMFMMHLTGHVWHQMRVMAAVVGGGRFERYPTLRIGFFEGGISWVPWWAERMDGHYNISHVTRRI